MDRGKHERLHEFLRRLHSAAPAGSHDDAYRLLCAALNGVEDEMTSIPYNPDLYRSDGRMYPPQADSARSVGELEGVIRYRSVRHNTRIHHEGGIRIDEVGGACLLSKPGKSGKTIDLP